MKLFNRVHLETISNNGKSTNKVAFSISLIFAVSFNMPGYCDTITDLHIGYVVLKFVSYILFAYWILKNYDRRYSILSLLVICFYVSLIVSTYIMKGSIYNLVVSCIPAVILVLFYDLASCEERLSIFKAFIIVLSILAILNLVTIVAFPNGIYNFGLAEKYYFLGHNNTAPKILFPLIVISGVYELTTQNKIGKITLFSWLIVFISVCLTWSNTAMFACAILGLYVVPSFLGKKPKWISAKLALVLMFALFLLVVVFQTSALSEFGGGLFGKDATFSRRTMIWSAAIQAISDQLILGYGYGVNVWSIVSFGFEPSSCHNYLLDLLFRGGIVHLLIQFLIILVISIRLDKSNSPAAAYIVAALSAYYVMWQFEPFVNTGFSGMFLVFIIGYTLNSFDSYPAKVKEARNDK